ATIISGQGTNQIMVNFGSGSGNVSVTEASSFCKNGPFNLYVNVGATTGINSTESNNDVSIYPNPSNEIINISSQKNIQSINIYNMLGQLIYNNQINSK